MNLNNFFSLWLGGIERLASPSKGLRSANSHVDCLSSLVFPMPSLPPELGQWLAPSVVLAMLGLILGLQGKRIDELRADMKEGFAQARADLRESEARQREDIAELKATNRALGEKLDRLVEALATAKQS